MSMTEETFYLVTKRQNMTWTVFLHTQFIHGSHWTSQPLKIFFRMKLDAFGWNPHADQHTVGIGDDELKKNKKVDLESVI
ncbi:886_t:CDS:2 [Rhizophagus irregularis]|nr:886_t:CDS:2 [Rhizophagus irregularis]